MRPFNVPGYDVLEMLSRGGGGCDSWLARETTSGDPVILKRLRMPADPRGRARLLRTAATWTAVRHPHVVRLRDVVETTDDLVLVFDRVEGISLSTILATRGAFSAGEVVTLAVPVALALAELGDQGLVHGGVRARTIFFSSDGKPVLGNFRLIDPLLPTADPASAASDVAALAAVCLAALGADADAHTENVGLLAVLRTATSHDPMQRPAAAELAAAVFDTCPARPIDGLSEVGGVVPVRQDAPVRLLRTPPQEPRLRTSGRAAGAGRRSAHARPRQRPWARIRLLLVVPLAAMAVGVGVMWADADTGVAGPAAAPTPGSEAVAAAGHGARRASKGIGRDIKRLDGDVTAWVTVLRRLDSARSLAFARGDGRALEQVYAPQSPAFRRDHHALARLVAAGTTARGLRLDIRSVQVVRAGPDRALLKVTDVLLPAEVIGAHGRAIATTPGRSAMQWVVTVARSEGGWRVYDVVPG